MILLKLLLQARKEDMRYEVDKAAEMVTNITHNKL